METLEVSRKAYNRLLEEYNRGEHDRFKLQALLPIWKENDEDLRIVYAKVLQYEVHRLFFNQKGLDEKRKRDRKVGKLRWKPPQRFRSFATISWGSNLGPGKGSSGHCTCRKLVYCLYAYIAK